MSIPALRTDDARFADLPDFPYSPNYLENLPGYEGLRMAYLDEGPSDGDVVLCLHGEPSWSYLYRKMIPVFTEAGHRVIAPDFFGFGRSDKPTEDSVYTFDFHRNALLAFIRKLNLDRFTLVVQDWGGLLGLTIPVDEPSRVARLLVMNTGLGVGVKPGPGFIAWRDYMANTPDLDVAKLMQRSIPGLTGAEAAAYGAPFPTAEHKAGVRRFPALVPTEPDADGVAVSRAAAAWWSNEWDGPTFMAVGMQDPVLGPPAMAWLRGVINGCPEPMEVDQGHFVQESGAEIAAAALAAWSAE